MTKRPEPKLYNTLTREKEVFKPIDEKNVRMYVCGPTVYDFAHIGNARPVIVFDVLYRLLRHIYGKGHVTYVRNITDVDDKINARALRDFGADIAAGKLTLNEAIRQVTEKTANQFHADVKALGCLEPDVEPRATEFVLPREDGKADMVTLIQSLLNKGHAYIATGKEGREVLFDVTSMKNYGALSNRKLEDQQSGARIAVESHKKNPGDFVLWKESASDQPGWKGVFKEGGATIEIHGRPGWHIECSAMSAAYLGETFDIHGGGLDLIFPHHENEIAQSCCAHDTPKMANYWMHNGYLQVEGKKMSKSDGNFVTIHDLLHTEKFGGRKWPGEVLRLAMLMTHYREPIDFSVKRLEEAENILFKWRRAEIGPETSFDLTSKTTMEVFDIICEDLNTPRLISWISQMLGNVNSRETKGAYALARDVLGIRFSVIEKVKISSSVEDDINRRLALLADKNFAEADRIRDELLAQGIQLKDSKDSETGERITTWEVKR
ncbi:MAG: cysteine--tRNA ligase [Salaquimonas sp.]